MFKKEKIKTLKILEVLIAVFAIISSITGIIFTDIYKAIAPRSEMPFIFALDLISFVAAITLLSSIFWKKKNLKLDIVRLGIIGYLFYAYGQYVMGTLYNYSYFLYLSVFGLSIFYLIIAFTGIEYEKLEFSIPKTLRIIIAVYCAAIPVFFAPQWIYDILNYIPMNSLPTKNGFDMMYYVYILDLCFVLPVCAIASVLLFQKKIMGFLLGGILLIKGVTLMLSVALGFFCQPLFHIDIDFSAALQFSIITMIFLALSIFFFNYSKIKI